MKIIGTIKHRFNEDYISKVSNLYELGITDYRFNYSKIEGNLSKEELFYQDVLKIQSIGNDIRTIIDIPYPRKKMRIVCQKNSMQINDGEKYILHIKKYNFIKEEKCNELWLDNDLAIRNFRLGMELIYDDGSGAFCVTEIYNNQNIIILKALNRFKLQNMKSISFGFLEENTYSNVVNKICKNIMPNDIALSFVENKFEKLKNANPEIKKFIYDQMDTIESVALSMANSLQPQLENLFSKGGLLANLTGSALSFISGVKDFLIGAIVSVYLLFSKELFTAQAKKVVYAFFSEQKSSKILSFSRDANEKFISFLSGKALDSFIIGMICFVAMNVLDLPYIVLISVIVGVTNMIPFFGPIIGAVPSALLILLSNPSKTVAFIIMIIILQQLDGNVIGPKILGNQLGMNAFWILFSIVIGGGLFGFVGMILAVPCFAVIYPMFKETVNSRLVKKQLSANTNDYFTEEKSIIVKDKKNKSK